MWWDWRDCWRALHRGVKAIVIVIIVVYSWHEFFVCYPEAAQVLVTLENRIHEYLFTPVLFMLFLIICLCACAWYPHHHCRERKRG